MNGPTAMTSAHVAMIVLLPNAAGEAAGRVADRLLQMLVQQAILHSYS